MINKLDAPSPSAEEGVADVPSPGDATLPIVKLGHPYRWMAAVVILLLAAWSVRILVVTPTFEWDVVWDYLFDTDVLLGVLRTLQMTVICMVVGVILGTVIAIMRLSPNPILKGVASFYQWFFRGTPTLIQLIFWFNLSSVFPSIEIELFGFTFVSWNTNELMTPFLAAVLGLSLNFAAITRKSSGRAFFRSTKGSPMRPTRTVESRSDAALHRAAASDASDYSPDGERDHRDVEVDVTREHRFVHGASYHSRKHLQHDLPSNSAADRRRSLVSVHDHNSQHRPDLHREAVCSRDDPECQEVCHWDILGSMRRGVRA